MSTTPNPETAATVHPAVRETDEQAIERLRQRASDILVEWGDDPLPPIPEGFQRRWRAMFGPVVDLAALGPRETHALMMATIESLQHAIHREVKL